MYGARLRVALAHRNVQLAAAFEQLEQQASHDDLTGVLNRRRIMELLREEHRRMMRTGEVFAAALIDIDHFKHVNDTFGHQVGDDVLRRITSVITTVQRETDRFGRHGGEEFLLLLTKVDDLATAAEVVDRLRATVSGAAWEDLVPGSRVTVSAGVAICHPNDPVERLLQRADAALYEAKTSGRDRVCAR